ncbi:hypothetical protein, conserved [Eimeria maxima]|uniref:Uncharacterized protein n=1 Tax=Eimeria maxima TaxID=5804 RepID=U6MF04_EIMMA|nr:hypothetical protein, conserved [Eimeria maxima]CDJ61019.1 hypothetical protein, conserved [Eimeria maxima]
MSILSVGDVQEETAASSEFQKSYLLSPLYSCDTPVLRFLLDASKTPASLQGSWENEKFLPPLDGALRIPFPAVSDAPPPPSPGKSENPHGHAEEPPRTRLASGATGIKNEACSISSRSHRQQQRQQQQSRSPQQRNQELVAARREQQQQVTVAHNEWRCAERMQRVTAHQQERHLESDLRQVLLMRPGSGVQVPFQGQNRQVVGLSFCPHRLASIYNLSIRYWDEGCASLAARTLKSAVQMLQQYGLVGGCVAHTWDAMQLLGGSKQQRPLGPAEAAAPPTGLGKRKLDMKNRYIRSRVFFSRRMFVAAERELEEVRGHLGSLLCRASLRGYASAVSGNAERRCSRIKEALARVEDDLLLLQELQARERGNASSFSSGSVMEQRSTKVKMSTIQLYRASGLLSSRDMR